MYKYTVQISFISVECHAVFKFFCLSAIVYKEIGFFYTRCLICYFPSLCRTKNI